MTHRTAGRWLFYRFARRLFLLVAAPLFRFRVSGLDHLPRHGGAVVVAAHRSWLDPACVGGACPRPLSFLILETVYRKRWARWFYRLMRSIPVSPQDPSSITALRIALRRLRRGELVGIFPEGRVYTEESPGPIHPGAALLALRGGVPVIPVDIGGSARAWPHGRRWPGPARVRVTIGAPIGSSASGGGRSGVEQLARKIEEALNDLRRARASADDRARRESEERA